MRRGLIRAGRWVLHILVLIIVFIAAVFMFERMLNWTAPDAAETMAESTFPLVYMQRGSVNFNCLHGYAQEMEPASMRESITPLSSDKEIGISIEAFSTTVDSVSYQVYTLDGSEQLENTSVLSIDRDGNTYSATLSLQSRMLMDQEYVLCIKVNSAGRDLYYYTHILLADGLHTDDYLNFVTGFYDKTVNRTDLDSVAAAVEPDDTTDEDQTLAHVDIHDSVSQLTWGSLSPQIYYKPIPRITEINDNTATLTLEYRILATNESGQSEIYNVNEYYRVRYTDSRVFLLNFERTTDEVFDPDNDVLESTGIRLGITDKDIQYKADDSSKIVAFVQENALWSYERSSSVLTKVFSFPQDENMDYRDFYDAHEITILRVESNGDIWFTVEGYMNRGTYEGENGVDLCFYEASTDMVDEMVFLRSSENHELLERSVSDSAYISEDGSVFSVLIGGTLYRVDTAARTWESAARTWESAAENIQDCCWVGNGGQYFAWLEEGEAYGSSTLNQIDLESGEILTISAASGEKIRPVAYMNDSLVYGLARDEDLALGSLDTGYFPMYALVIIDGEGNTLKNYEPEGLYITEVEQADHMLSLTRMSKSEDGTSFVEAAADQIMDTNTESSVSLGSATDYDSRKQTQVYLRVGGTISDTSPEVVTSKVITHAEKHIVDLTEAEKTSTQTEDDHFYVYAAGGLYDIFSRANEALACADEQYGVVLDGSQQYMWVRGDKSTTAEIQLTKVPDVMKNGVTTLEELADGIDGTALDLTGCTLEQVLYFVSHGTPVAAQTADGPVTIVGYDDYNTYLLDPGTDEWYYYGINDSTELFETAGNIFYTYME